MKFQKADTISGAFLLTGALMFSSPAHAATDRGFPDTIDPSKNYMFYMHGNYVEKNGPFKNYKYYEILDAFEAKGFIVIGEARGPTKMGKYAKMVAGQVKDLLNAGVPADRITVAGHSRGGFIAMQVASNLKNPDIRYGALAACGLKGTSFGRNYKNLLKKRASRMEGNFLVMWERSDNVAGHCDEAMNKAANVTFKNMELTVGLGHHLFYEPAASWIDPLTAFAKGQ